MDKPHRLPGEEGRFPLDQVRGRTMPQGSMTTREEGLFVHVYTAAEQELGEEAAWRTTVGCWKQSKQRQGLRLKGGRSPQQSGRTRHGLSSTLDADKARQDYTLRREISEARLACAAPIKKGAGPCHNELNPTSRRGVHLHDEISGQDFRT
eukprot:scaffold1235_cov300-Pavlova_lutheri.AAC.15